MALATRITNAAAIAACNAITALIGSGAKLRIYSGTQPVNADTGLSGNTLLAELALSATPFGSAVDATDKATATANAVTADSSADAAGTATWFRVVTSGGTTIWDGSVGTSGADLNLNSVSITLGANVSISGWTFTMPEF
jgi:hypothetical protein